MSAPDATCNRPVFLAARRALRAVVGPPLRRWTGFVVEHPERLPRRREPMLVACNHAAFADTVFLSLAIRPRFVVCGAKPRLFRNRRRRALMALGNVLRVDGRASYLASCARLLADGEILLVYPEMSRNPDRMGAFSTWPAEVALAAGVPILPTHLRGTTRGDTGYRLRVGARIPPTGDAATLTAQVRAAIAALEAT